MRRLLEDQQTWDVAGRGTVEDLATRIGSCLQACVGRTAEDSHAAALTIARGLLEFAVADLEPKLFQQVLLARLHRMETGQESALDMALLGLHARFDSMLDQLKLVLDRLPPGPARRGEIAVYLRTLIDWLSTDPWPRDPQFGGSVLTPAAIERKLRVTAMGQVREQDLDADRMAQQSMRLMILGGPGSGKTWLAKRTARRCAEDALQVLAAGGTLDEIELPLYTTCSRLFGAGGDIREAVVWSALDQLADLGGSRISKALGVFFAERNAPTLLVIDSLDEAHGRSERLHQADTLPWRIVLTSRPSSWRNQLTINDTDGSHRVGELQPLRYPDDVEPFIERWFAGRPERAKDLAVQIARRPGLQQAATVPLILAFYCIVGGTEPLPDFRHDLYTKVLNRMLTGRWRGDDDRQPDADTCLQTLRAWAWDGAASNHPVSGVGTWTDDIPTKPVQLGEADKDPLDHVAAPLGPPNVDTRKTLRRFVHRSIREHLVAEHVASLPVDEAAKVMLPHLWYDPDWEYSAPAALARHPQHDQLMRDLISHAAKSDQIPTELSVIDAGWEFRGLLARVATESREADWSPEVAAMIGQARVELARSGRFGDLGGAAHWGTSNRQARSALLGWVAGHADLWVAGQLVGGLAGLAPAAEDKRQACEALLSLLARQTDGWVAGLLVGGLAGLAPTAEDKRQAREALLSLLTRQTDHYVAERLVGGLARLDPPAEDKRQAREALLSLLARQTDHRAAERLAGGLAGLDPTAEDKRRAREALLGLLVRQADGSVAGHSVAGQLVGLVGRLVQLDPTADDKRQGRSALLGLLADQTGGWDAERLVGAVVQLAPAAEDKRQAREALLRLLPRQTDHSAAGVLVGAVVQLAPAAEDKRQAREALLGLLARQPNGLVAGVLVGAVVQLAPAAEDKRQAREALLGLLAGQTNGWVAGQLVGGLAGLDPTAEDKRQAREALLGLLAGQADGSVAGQLVGQLVQLDPTAEDKRQGRSALLGLLADQTGSWGAERLVGAVVQLAPAAEDKRQAREALLSLLPRQTDHRAAGQLMDGLAGLDPTPEDKRQAREALLGLLVRQTDSWVAGQLVGGLAGLDPTAEDKRRAREALLGLLAGQTNGSVAGQLVGGLAGLDPTAEDKRRAREALAGLDLTAEDKLQAREALAGLDPTAEDKRQAREALLSLLAGQTETLNAQQLVGRLVQLDPTAEDKRQGRSALLGLLAGQTGSWDAERLVGAVVQLAPAAEDKRQAREALLSLLAGQTDNSVTEQLMDGLAGLDPTPEDKRRAREALLVLLVRHPDSWAAEQLVGAVVQLAPAAEDKRQVRKALLWLLARQTDNSVAEQLVGGVVQLDPTIRDLSTWRAWTALPTPGLLAVARRNSPLLVWLAALPSLSPLSG